MRLLFLHGWGFDASLWDGLRRALAPLESFAWDRGYFGPPQDEPVCGPVLAIGHSLGSLILGADPPPSCIGLVAINGFDRFAGEGAVPRRVVDRMQRRFARRRGHGEAPTLAARVYPLKRDAEPILHPRHQASNRPARSASKTNSRSS